MSTTNEGNCRKCTVRTDKTVYFRRCFMTGEYCSKQRDIRVRREKQHRADNDKADITAFVIMDFSNISDVIYERQIKPFIERLTNHFTYNIVKKTITCREKNEGYGLDREEKKVNNIHVVRADSSFSSNFVICNRICQQMQTADLIVVDVSCKNVNVFYELGMAIALDKLILPICYSDSFYRDIRTDKEMYGSILSNQKRVDHIGSHPWRKMLYEYFGIMYSDAEDHIRYDNYEKISPEKEYYKTDIKYKKYPYGAPVSCERNTVFGLNRIKSLGNLLYNCLANGYNVNTRYGQDIGLHNSVVLYTGDKVHNEQQAWLCIINFYETITRKLHEGQCFSGSRIGVLIHHNPIYEENKDSPEASDNNNNQDTKGRYITYNNGEIINIGVNQASSLAYKEQIRDLFDERDMEEKGDITGNITDEEREIDFYFGNRAVLMYPEDPVYVERLENVQSDLREDLKLHGMSSVGHASASSSFWHTETIKHTKTVRKDRIEKNNELFCLYHVMLNNLKNVNQVVVDITDNSIQNLFWLGVAHGLNVDAVTIKYVQNQLALKPTHPDYGKYSYRNIFDVSGLWTAEFEKNNTNGFYQQLCQVQESIAKQHKLIPETEPYDDDLLKSRFDREAAWKAKEKERIRANNLMLESYYRRKIWNALLKYNELGIYINEKSRFADETPPEDINEILRRNIQERVSDTQSLEKIKRVLEWVNDNPKRQKIRVASHWDMNSAAEITNYLSKRTAIGESAIKVVSEITEWNNQKKNCIIIGSDIKLPDTENGEESFVSYLKKKIVPYNKSNGPQKIEYLFEKNDAKHFTSDAYDTEQVNIEKKTVCISHIPNMTDLTISTEGQNNKFNEYSKYEYILCPVVEEIPLAIIETGHEDNGDNKDNLLGQLILWNQKSNFDDSLNSGRTEHSVIAFNGISGPATFALASLFTDQDQKNKIYNPEYDVQLKTSHFTKDYIYLVELQNKIRDRYIAGFIKHTVKEKCNPICNDLISIVKFFLHKELVKYFLPLHSRKDVYSICNSFKYYLDSLDKKTLKEMFENAEISYGQDSAHNKTIPSKIASLVEILKQDLMNFCGVQAFYQIEVEQPGEKGEVDRRRVEKIRLITGGKLYKIYSEDRRWEAVDEDNESIKDKYGDVLNVKCLFLDSSRKRYAVENKKKIVTAIKSGPPSSDENKQTYTIKNSDGTVDSSPIDKTCLEKDYIFLHGDKYRYKNKPILIWESSNPESEEIKYLKKKRMLMINRYNEKKYFIYPTGKQKKHAKDAVVIFNRVDRDPQNKNITNIEFDIVSREDFNKNYSYC